MNPADPYIGEQPTQTRGRTRDAETPGATHATRATHDATQAAKDATKVYEQRRHQQRLIGFIKIYY